MTVVYWRLVLCRRQLLVTLPVRAMVLGSGFQVPPRKTARCTIVGVH